MAAAAKEGNTYRLHAVDVTRSVDDYEYDLAAGPAITMKTDLAGKGTFVSKVISIGNQVWGDRGCDSYMLWTGDQAKLADLSALFPDRQFHEFDQVTYQVSRSVLNRPEGAVSAWVFKSTRPFLAKLGYVKYANYYLSSSFQPLHLEAQPDVSYMSPVTFDWSDWGQPLTIAPPAIGGSCSPKAAEGRGGATYIPPSPGQTP